MLTMDEYQASHELKRYIADGKEFIKELEADVYEEPPPFIQAYVSGSTSRRAELDGYLRDMKTQARLQSKGIWYGWRCQLLADLERGLRANSDDFAVDAKVLEEKNQILKQVLPSLQQQKEQMQAEVQLLQQAATSEEEKEALNTARNQITDVTCKVEERKRMVAAFRSELEEQKSLVEAYAESKTECAAAIQSADKVRESCRGWSVDEVAALKGVYRLVAHARCDNNNDNRKEQHTD